MIPDITKVTAGFSSVLDMGTICDDLLPPPGVGCGNPFSANATDDYLEFAVSLRPDAIDDDGLLRFGMSAAIF